MPDSKKLIRSKIDLPKSFKLDNYIGTEHLDANGWAKALVMRDCLRTFNRSLNWSDLNHKQISKIYNPVFQNPLHSQENLERIQMSAPRINQLTVHDLYRLLHYIQLPTKYKKAATEVKDFFADHWEGEPTEDLSESAKQFISMTLDSIPFTRSTDIYLSVDITCSDEQLIEEFIKTINLSRGSRDFNPRKSKYNELSFKKWHRLAVMPYLDLSLWAEANGVSIKPRVFSEAIYRDTDKEYSNTRTISETVTSLASELLQHETLTILCAQGKAK